MKMLGFLITACVVLAAAQAAIAVLAVFALGGLVYGLFVAPRETLGLIGLLAVVGLVQSHPAACLGIAATGVMIKLINRP
jgi:quinol-cytochrome oxidoreductase complex cytochrome b subunit